MVLPSSENERKTIYQEGHLKKEERQKRDNKETIKQKPCLSYTYDRKLVERKQIALEVENSKPIVGKIQ